MIQVITHRHYASDQRYAGLLRHLKHLLIRYTIIAATVIFQSRWRSNIMVVLLHKIQNHGAILSVNPDVTMVQTRVQ